MKLSRREFMKSGSLVAMLGALAPSLLLDTAKSDSKRGYWGDVIRSNTILRINSKDVGVLNSISMNAQRDMIDVTSLDENSDYKDFVSYHKTNEVNLSLVPAPRTVLTLERGLETAESQSFEIIMEDTEFAFEGYITSVQTSKKEIVATVMIDSSVTMT